jgi:hypothetical protein
MAKRELSETGTKRNVRRDKRGRFVGGRGRADRRTTTSASVQAPAGKGTATTRRTTSFFNRPLVMGVALVAGLIAVGTGAVLTSPSLRRGVVRPRT